MGMETNARDIHTKPNRKLVAIIYVVIPVEHCVMVTNGIHFHLVGTWGWCVEKVMSY
jgi:hypothetical protein